MRFVSKYRNYEFVAIPTREPEKALAYGLKAELPVICKFQHGGLSDWEKTEALKIFKFGGAGHDEHLWQRLSFYDTELEAVRLGWDEETKERVEARLLSAPSYGVDFIQVEKPRLEPPWPSYDEVKKPAEIISVTRAIGIDPAVVIAYELENQNRDAIVNGFSSDGKESESEPLIPA